MAVDKLVDSAQLDSDLGDIADAIRAKTGGSSQIAFPSGFISGIGSLADPSGTTAVAADVAQGKLFLDSSGVLTQGTASGGGGTFTPVMGVIRPDATLVQTYSYDKLFVHDLEGTIPAYTTSTKTLISSATLADAMVVDNENYNYFCTTRSVAYPVYDSRTKPSASYEEYYYYLSYFEYIYVPGSEMKSIDGTRSCTANHYKISGGALSRLVYTNSNGILTNGDLGYGFYVSSPNNSVNTTTGKLTIKSPYLSFRGNSSYLPSTALQAVTDVRFQYIVDLYRVANSNNDLAGWTGRMLSKRILAICGNNGTLT